MDTATRTELIRRYREGYATVEQALAGASNVALDRADSEGWTARQVAHHLADSEMTSALRLRKLIAEQAPVIYGYDEEAFARSLHYDVRPIEASLLAFRAARESTATLLEVLSEDDWSRSGWHTESGLYTVETWLEIYAAHAHDHAEQIRRALRVSG
ncbi:MAG: DinB family protein [Dehalococcoidia bacterium]